MLRKLNVIHPIPLEHSAFKYGLLLAIIQSLNWMIASWQLVCELLMTGPASLDMTANFAFANELPTLWTHRRLCFSSKSADYLSYLLCDSLFNVCGPEHFGNIYSQEELG